MEPLATSDAAQDYRGLREAAGRLESSRWTILRLMGPDTATFLQGLATQDLEQVREGEAAETFFLNEKGRPVALSWVWIARDGSSALVFTEEHASGTLAQHLGRFRIMEEVEIEQLAAPALSVFAGPERDRLLADDARRLAGAIAIRSTPFSFLYQTDGAVPSGSVPGLKPVDALAAEAWRLSVGIPRAGIDFDLDRIVTEVNRPQAISLTKGCYVGQEIVARTSGRGHVRRLRTGFRFRWPGTPVAPKSEIQLGGRPVGFVTSSAPEPGSRDGLAMGYLSTDLPPDAALTIASPEPPISLRASPWPL